MEAVLLERFSAYVVDHHPELVMKSPVEYPLSQWVRERMTAVLPTLKFLQDKGAPVHVVIATCMEELTRDLRPSKADYLSEVLAKEFPREQRTMVQARTLTYNVVELIRHCDEVLQNFGFRESNVGSTLLRHAVIAEVAEYLNDLKI